MKYAAFALASFLLLASTLASGFLHEQLSGPLPDDSLARERLEGPLSERVGNWRMKIEDKFPEQILEILENPGYIARRYVHEQTGDEVTVAVLVGASGPIAVHTPEICYSARDYSVVEQRKEIEATDAAGGKHSLWQLDLKANDLNAGSLRVMYAWSTGTQWQAAKRPRFEYGGQPHLYKLQIAVTTTSATAKTDFDPGQDFFSQFAAQLQPRMVEASRIVPESR